MKLEQRIEKIELELDKIKSEIKKDIKFTRIGDLLWSEDLGSGNWHEAVEKAESIGARLPERWEIIKAYDEHEEEMNKLIEDSPSNFFWSFTENSSTKAWYVYLNGGTTASSSKSTSSAQIRCVR
jgi:2-keto-4-pentenoate hydratase/2-oxohepta-3-ene-1,7-dioic acid hydratase in catechol pathway